MVESNAKLGTTIRNLFRCSQDQGGIVLDPFCGCATKLVAADQLEREWCGIDLSPLAIKLVDELIAQERGIWGGANALTEPPKRTHSVSVATKH